MVRRAKLLRPRLGPGVVPRPRLVAQLDRGLDHPLVLVVGPAGFGKTTLLAEWLAATPRSAAWLALDEGDDDLARFGPLLVAALRSAERAAGVPADLFSGPHPPSPEEFGSALGEALLDLEDDLVLVLDDLHTLTDPGVHAALAALLRYPPPRLRLVLSSRTDPPLPLARLRGHGLVAEIRAADLRFTEAETVGFLAGAVDAAVDGATVALLHERTEGWPAGLRLASLALRDRDDTGSLARAFAASGQRYVMDFLIDEVLSRQPSPVQAFLLRTALLDRVCAPLADALGGDPALPSGSAAMLDHLSRGDLYLEPIGPEPARPDPGGSSPGDAPAWYRFHPLFRELLRHRLLVTEGEAAVTALHLRAGRWFAGSGLLPEAIRHLLAAGAADEAVALVERHVHPALDGERWPEVRAWLRALGDRLVHGRAALLLASAWVGQLNGRARGLRPLLAEAEALLAETDHLAGTATDEALRGELDALFDAADGFDRDHAASLAAGRRALDRLPPTYRFARGYALVGVGAALQALGRAPEGVRLMQDALDQTSLEPDAFSVRALIGLALIHLREGDLHECEVAASRAAQLAAGLGLETTVGWARHFLGVAALERNDLERAVAHFSAVLALRERGHRLALRESAFGLALASAALGRHREAEATVERLTEDVLEAGNAEHLPTVASLRARLALLRGDPLPVGRWLDGVEPGADRDPLHRLELTPLTRAHALIARGTRVGADLDEAERILAAVAERAAAGHCLPVAIRVLALEALARAGRGNASAAQDALERALTLAAPRGHVRPFVELGPPMARLLADRAEAAGPSPYLAGLAAAFGAAPDLPERASAPDGTSDRLVELRPAPTLGPVPVRAEWIAPLELLTDRELQILERLRLRLSNKEIADQLFISPLTVKRHASNIYDKLGVANRRQAILRAAELGVLPGL